MKITVVTVAFNEEKNIAQTIESVLTQTSNDFEYIICDGKSKDSTVQIAESYKDAFAANGVDYKIYSEKDGGIYYGMNNAIDRASGEYIYFLNAGDWFYSADVVKKVCEFIDQNAEADIIYGHIAQIERNVVRIATGNDEYLLQDMSICHQAVFTRPKLMKEHKFNTEYRIVADYDFFLGRKLENCIFKQIDCVIAYFSLGGISTVNAKVVVAERIAVSSSHGMKIDKRKLRIQRYKIAIAYKIKSAMPLKLWYWWSVKIKHKELL